VSPKADPYYSQPNGLRNTKGFGQVKPHTIFYGGDPTSASAAGGLGDGLGQDPLTVLTSLIKSSGYTV
jgi:hypothetical protein